MTDKEKLEKALVHLKKFIDGDCVCDSDILADFPELRESEDEKIIEEIRFAVMQMHSERQDTKDRCLAWLEKQKEQKHPDGCFTCDEYKKGYEAGRLNDFTVGYNKAMKEQKPVEKQDYSGLNDFERAIHRGFLSAGVENVSITIIKETAWECLAQMNPAEWNDTDMKEARDSLISVCRDWEYGKQTTLIPLAAVRARYFLEHLTEPKQEWSEEDEEIRDNIICILQKDVTYTPPTRPNSCTGSGNAFYTHQTEIDWLKSLRPQPIQEWSEEDEKILHAIELQVGQLDSGETINGYSSSDMLRVLKSRRPSWKPSEEQMSMLRAVINDPNNSGAESCQIALRGIYEQLKKL